MEIATQLMVGESISYAKKDITDAIRKGLYPENDNWYALTTAYERVNLLYIMSGKEFRHPMYKRMNLRLVGIAGSRKEAFLLVQSFVQHSVDSNSLMEMKHSLNEL